MWHSQGCIPLKLFSKYICMFLIWLKLLNDKPLKLNLNKERPRPPHIYSGPELRTAPGALWFHPDIRAGIRKVRDQVATSENWGISAAATFTKWNLSIRDGCLKSGPGVTCFLLPHASQTWLLEPLRRRGSAHYNYTAGLIACLHCAVSYYKVLANPACDLFAPPPPVLTFWFLEKKKKRNTRLIITTVFNFADNK